MGKSLVIVESPAKAKTISKILGKDFQVKASVGHVRDLPPKKLGVNVRKNFEPLYEVPKDKIQIVEELKEAANDADAVFLAPDPDREGEAIAWHLSQVLDLPKKKLHRIEFNEITKDAVLSALKMPRQIAQRLVNAQQARRVLDRLVGYKISPLLWRKVNGRSAGRVQSVAVRLICEREEEIGAFEPKEYWSIKADFSRARSKQAFAAALTRWQGKRVVAASDKQSAQTIIVDSEKFANTIVKSIDDKEFSVKSLVEKSSQRQPQPPFITSTMQRDAATQIGFGVNRTMKVAQDLYEGIDLGADGTSGLITYMRTDSTRVAQQAQDEALKFIKERYGKEYCPDKPRIYVRKAKSVQDAHEAIRPSYPDRTPESIKQYLNSDQYKLYKLIWERFMASQMASAELVTRSAEITAGEAIFKASATETKFQGFLIVYKGSGEKETNDAEDDDGEGATTNLPELSKGEVLKMKSITPSQHFTQPPPRYTEASLVKTLEEMGIGRPSTYAATVETIGKRKYVERINKTLVPTKLGQAVNLLLVEHFGSIVDVGFTAEMEEKLDQIEEEKVEWQRMLKGFYETFQDTLKKAEENMNKVTVLSDQQCPQCGQPMAIRSSRYGQFLGCVGYPECKTKIALTKEGKPVPADRPSDEICPACASAMVIRHGRYGDYLACSSEECTQKNQLLKKTGLDCPREGCGGVIVEKKTGRGKTFWGCSLYKDNQCTSAYWYPPLLSGGAGGGNTCPKCGALVVYKTLKRGDQIACSKKDKEGKGCDWSEMATGKEVHVASPQAPEAAPTPTTV